MTYQAEQVAIEKIVQMPTQEATDAALDGLILCARILKQAHLACSPDVPYLKQQLLDSVTELLTCLI